MKKRNRDATSAVSACVRRTGLSGAGAARARRTPDAGGQRPPPADARGHKIL
jgi:hypothetical protein